MTKRSFLKALINSKYVNRWIIFLCDIAIACVSTMFVLLFITYIRGTAFTPYTNINLLLLSLICGGIGIFLCRTYCGIIRHSTMSEAGRLGMAAIVKVILIYAAIALFLPEISKHVCIIGCIIDCIFTFFLLVLSRVVIISIYHLLINNITSNRESLLIFIGEDNTTTLSGSLFNRLGHYQIDGYLRIGSSRTSMRIGEYKVYSVQSYEDFHRLMESHQVKHILFTNRIDVENEQERLIRYCEKLKIQMLMLPAVDELKNGKISNRKLPELRIEDLLGRDEIHINMAEVVSEFDDKVVLVTGAAGSIGSELCRQLAKMNIKKLIMFDSAETPLHNVRLEFERDYPELDFVPVIGDVRIIQRLHMVFEKYKPQIIFHAAAYKHVPLMEENPCEAVLANVVGTRQVADMALKYNAEKMIMISTDKAVNPTNIMGASKRLAEIYVQSLGCAIQEGKIKGKTKYITTRFGNVLGSNGSVIPRFREQIANGGPVTVTHPDIIRYFMTIPEACRLVMEATTMGKGNEIFVFEMGKPVKILDLATRMIELAGYIPNEDIKITFTGLRPGEKLYEEVLSDEENTIPTDHKKIKIAKVREYDYAEILDTYDKFKKLSSNVEVMDTVRLMKQVVPEFKSKNSKFEMLDKGTRPK